MPDDRQFFAYAETDTAHGHSVRATTFEAAAVAFAECYRPAVDASGEVRVHVQADDTGVEHCFTIDLDDDRARPCD